MTPSGDALQVEGLVKRYGTKTVLAGLSFEIAPGEVLGLLGPNGAGKTTTFLCLAGLIRPDGGTISFDGRRLDSDRGRTIALIPETPDVYPMLTVWEHLAFVAASARLDADWQKRASDLLARFALSSERDTLGQSLSKGMRQKTLIAATVLAGTPVLLLDEPMIGLDPRGQRELRELIGSLRGTGTAIALSTHLLESAEALCDRVIIMKDGAAVAQGDVASLRSAEGGERSLEELFLEITS